MSDLVQQYQNQLTKTKIVFILDKSGSMYTIEDDAIGGFNAFIEEQKRLPGEATLKLILFSTESEVAASGPIQSIEPLTRETYRPHGGTAMLDAIGMAIDTTIKEIDEEEDTKPTNVIFVIMTDGQENSSHEYSLDLIKKKIEDMQTTAKWQFIFMGANMDAVSEAGSLGIAKGMSMNYTADAGGMFMAYSAMSDAVTSYRTTGEVDAHWSDHNGENSTDSR